jgi:hypothetical protein
MAEEDHITAGRSQFRTSRGWIKRDTAIGRIMDRKADTQPFKGVRRER